MSTLIDMTGQRFGKLTVIKKLPSNPKYKAALWLCRCDCGGEKIVPGSALRRGDVKSCGCASKVKLVYIKNDPKEKKHYTLYNCPYNEGCQCSKMQCYKCGWNPKVAKQRLERMGIINGN